MSFSLCVCNKNLKKLNNPVKPHERFPFWHLYFGNDVFYLKSNLQHCQLSNFFFLFTPSEFLNSLFSGVHSGIMSQTVKILALPCWDKVRKKLVPSLKKKFPTTQRNLNIWTTTLDCPSKIDFTNKSLAAAEV